MGETIKAQGSRLRRERSAERLKAQGLIYKIFVIFLILYPYPLYAKGHKKVRILVLDFKSVGDREYFGPLAAENLRNRLKEEPIYYIIRRKSINIGMERTGMEKVDFEDKDKILELGSVFAADKIIYGSLKKNWDKSHTISITMLDVSSNKIEEELELTNKPGGNIDSLMEKSASLLRSVLPHSNSPPPKKKEKAPKKEFDFEVDPLGLYVENYRGNIGNIKRGVKVIHVARDTTAYLNGIKEGDIIHRIDGRLIKNRDIYRSSIDEGHGKEVLLEIYRNRRMLYIVMDLK